VAGLIAAFLYNHYHLHTQAALIALELGVVSICSSYGIFFLGSLLVNTVRVPWLLDAESGEQIDALETRVSLAESKAEDKAATQQEKKRLHDLFGGFMKEGESLADELRRGMQSYGPWLQKRREWVERVSQALTDMGLPTEAAGFRQAGEKDRPIFPPGTVESPRLYYDLYSSQLTGYRTKLQEIVSRRLP
jgi:hypothetical protein